MRYRPAHRRRAPRPWVLLWLVPMLWAAMDSGLHDPDGCICHEAAQSQSASHGHESEARTAPRDAPAWGASHADDGDDCLECQWISAAAFAVPTIAPLHVQATELTVAPPAVYSLVSISGPRAASRGPPVC